MLLILRTSATAIYPFEDMPGRYFLEVNAVAITIIRSNSTIRSFSCRQKDGVSRLSSTVTAVLMVVKNASLSDEVDFSKLLLQNRRK